MLLHSGKAFQIYYIMNGMEFICILWIQKILMPLDMKKVIISYYIQQRV